MKSWQLHGGICVALAAITIVCMGRVVGNDFINLDDPTYVYQNPPVIGGLSWSGVQWAFTTTHAAFWIPLTWLSLQLDATLFWSGPPGLASASAAAWGFHLTNLLLHVGNTLLAYWLIFRLTGRPGLAVCVAVLFGIHPLHVESVAWITERKDVLSTFLGLLSLLAYVRYQEKPGVKRMVLVGLLFACSLMAKPVMVILPGVMLLLDWWRRVRFGQTSWKWIILEKVPLFGLSLACTLITVLAHREAHGVADLERMSLYVRTANALVSYQAYLVKTIWPMDLGVFYPHPVMYQQPDDPFSYGKVALAMFILIAVTVPAVLLRRTLPALLVGWLWFLGALLPNIGLVQAGNQAMADRFCYFGLLGLFLALISVADRLLKAAAGKVAIFVPFAVAYGILAWVQAGYWRDSLTLYDHTLAVTHKNRYIHGFLGFDLYNRGMWDAAEKHLAEYAAGRKGGFARFQFSYGDLLWRRYLKTNRADPNLAESARTHLIEAVRGDPKDAGAHLTLALALMDYAERCKSDKSRLEDHDKALQSAAEQLRSVIQLSPENGPAYLYLAVVLANLGAPAEAGHWLQTGIECTQDPMLLKQMRELQKTLAEAAP